uniref:E2F transcription factor CC-MB domain-containing protein n=1 Tax=Scleropages formosus TaxID=113540 RepID=A0A8C9R600_SCLFO
MGCRLSDFQGTVSHFQGLRSQLRQLAQEEEKLDKLINRSNVHMKEMSEEDLGHKYPDIRTIECLQDQTVVVIKAPYETKLEVPGLQEKYQIHLSSIRGPIDVFLCPDVLPPSPSESTVDENGNSSVLPLSKVLALNCSDNVCGQKSSPDSSVTVGGGSAVGSPFACLDQNLVNLMLPANEEYLLSLGEEEGISDLFDAFDFDRLPLDGLF